MQREYAPAFCNELKGDYFVQSYFKITTNKPPLSYRVGEEICIFVRAYNCCNEVPCRYFRFTLQGDDGQSTTGLGHSRPGEPFVLKTSCARPGFLHLNCVAYNENNGLFGRLCLPALYRYGAVPKLSHR